MCVWAALPGLGSPDCVASHASRGAVLFQLVTRATHRSPLRSSPIARSLSLEFLGTRISSLLRRPPRVCVEREWRARNGPERLREYSILPGRKRYLLWCPRSLLSGRGRPEFRRLPTLQPAVSGNNRIRRVLLRPEAYCCLPKYRNPSWLTAIGLLVLAVTILVSRLRHLLGTRMFNRGRRTSGIAFKFPFRGVSSLCPITYREIPGACHFNAPAKNAGEGDGAPAPIARKAKFAIRPPRARPHGIARERVAPGSWAGSRSARAVRRRRGARPGAPHLNRAEPIQNSA
jgi:hypothetical protein